MVAIMFTWSTESFYVRYEDGTQRHFTPLQLRDEVGDAEYDRLARTAAKMTGHWHVLEPIATPR